MQKIFSICLILFICLNLNACSYKAKRALGLTRKAPDEFTVIARAPLTVPPVYDMRPPKLGEVRPQEGTTLEAARSAIITDTKSSAEQTTKTVKELSSGENVLLSKAGTDNASADIRKIIDQETTSLIEESKGFVDKLVFWRKPEDPSAVEVDPNLEAKRIQENNALGKEITEGETPVIERKRKGIFER